MFAVPAYLAFQVVIRSEDLDLDGVVILLDQLKDWFPLVPGSHLC